MGLRGKNRDSGRTLARLVRHAWCSERNDGVFGMTARLEICLTVGFFDGRIPYE